MEKQCTVPSQCIGQAADFLARFRTSANHAIDEPWQNMGNLSRRRQHLLAFPPSTSFLASFNVWGSSLSLNGLFHTNIAIPELQNDVARSISPSQADGYPSAHHSGADARPKDQTSDHIRSRTANANQDEPSNITTSAMHRLLLE